MMMTHSRVRCTEDPPHTRDLRPGSFTAIRPTLRCRASLEPPLSEGIAMTDKPVLDPKSHGSRRLLITSSTATYMPSVAAKTPALLKTASDKTKGTAAAMIGPM